MSSSITFAIDIVRWTVLTRNYSDAGSPFNTFYTKSGKSVSFRSWLRNRFYWVRQKVSGGTLQYNNNTQKAFYFRFRWNSLKMVVAEDVFKQLTIYFWELQRSKRIGVQDTW